MESVDDAIFDRLEGSDDLVALVAPYRGVTAIFTRIPIPRGVIPPFVVVPPAPLEGAGPFDTKNSKGRLWVRDIGCYARANQSSVVDQMATIVFDLFHRRGGELFVEGFVVMIANAAGPFPAPTDDTMYGRIVTVTLSAAAEIDGEC